MKKYFLTFITVMKYVLVYIISNIFIATLIGTFLLIQSNSLDGTRNLQQYISAHIFQITLYVSLISLAIFLSMVKKTHNSINGFLCFKKISLYCINLLVIVAIAFSILSICATHLLIKLFPSYHNVSQTLTSSHSSYFSLACVLVLLPIFEEIFFRGILYNEMRLRINAPLAIFIQALLFAVFHGNMLQGIYTFFLAIILALSYTWTGSLWSPIIIHILFNLLGSLILPPLLFLTQGFFIAYITCSAIISLYIIYKLYKVTTKEIYY